MPQNTNRRGKTTNNHETCMLLSYALGKAKEKIRHLTDNDDKQGIPQYLFTTVKVFQCKQAGETKTNFANCASG